MFLRVAFCGISVVLVFRVLLDMLCMKAAELADRLVNTTGNYYYEQENCIRRSKRDKYWKERATTTEIKR